MARFTEIPEHPIARREVESGLPDVTLVGVELRTCPSHGELEVVIPKIEELHRTLAKELPSKRPSFTEQEIRFLRKYLG
jgi:hypothetical protein